MEMLYINCPVTGMPEPTGYTARRTDNLNNIDAQSFICTRCGQTHLWDGSMAFFADETTAAGKGAV